MSKISYGGYGFPPEIIQLRELALSSVRFELTTRLAAK
jgi:hypothetical protein